MEHETNIRRIVHEREGGTGFDVYEGRVVTDKPVSLEEAEAIVARKEGKLN